MPQKRNPCSLEVIKAKASLAHGILVSLLSLGKALFMGYNRDTQWTKYWVMDLVDECQPTIYVITDVIKLLQVNKDQMRKWALEGFSGATALMEWMVQHSALPLRKAKMVVEKAVQYSEREKKERVSYSSLKKAIDEMKIQIPITEEEIERVQNPEWVLTQISAIGTPSKRRLEENMTSLRRKLDAHWDWVKQENNKILKAKQLILRMEKGLRG